MLSIGQDFALEQSERPEGPWLTTYVQQTEVRDYEHNRVRLETQRRNWSYPNWSPLQTTVILPDVAAINVGTRWLPTTPRPIEETMALDPERLLLTVRAAKDLRALPDETQQKIAQHVVGFTYKDQKMRLLLNPWTHLPTMLESIANDGIWGDVTTRKWYSFWTLEKGGLMYPRQISTQWNGFPRFDETVQGLVVDGPIDESAFAMPDDARAASVKLIATRATQPAPPPSYLTLDASKSIAVADFVTELAGGYNVSLVRQPDGIVVIEGTTSSDYSEQVLAHVAKAYPGVPVKAVVTTSDAWPHVGGIRPYVARGVPIYPLDLNVSILSRVVTAPHTIAPDALARAPKTAVYRPVTDKTTIGTGDTRMELIPVRGETGERMMIAWFPGAHLLYSSDLIQRGSGGKGFFMPEMLLEVSAALEREHITGVDRVFGMHLAPTPWTEVQSAIAEAKGA
jgi:glyoxylase-like metal-dependent hydrolase (beta-lactamase superfamily II)